MINFSCHIIQISSYYLKGFLANITTLKYRIKEHARLFIFNILPSMLALILPCLFNNFWILPLLLVYSVFPKKAHGTATL